MDDVAAAAGVGRGTVSRVVNGADNVSPHARQAVLEAIRRTGYVVNPHARWLVTQRSQSVVLALSAVQEPLFEDPQFYALMRGCVRALTGHGLTLALMIADSTGSRAEVQALTTAGHVDGALTMSAHSSQSLMGQLRSTGVPVVGCGRPVRPDAGDVFVAADDRRAAAAMVRYLMQRGRNRIATITAPLDTPAGVDRLTGYHDIVGRSVDPRLVIAGGYTRDSGYDATRHLLARVPDIDAVFAASGPAALGALQALHATGRRVPDDVAVGGFDDSEAAAASRPALTTIGPPLAQVSAEMVRLLLDRLAHRPTRPVMVPSQLIIRDSA